MTLTMAIDFFYEYIVNAAGFPGEPESQVSVFLVVVEVISCLPSLIMEQISIPVVAIPWITNDIAIQLQQGNGRQVAGKASRAALLPYVLQVPTLSPKFRIQLILNPLRHRSLLGKHSLMLFSLPSQRQKNWRKKNDRNDNSERRGGGIDEERGCRCGRTRYEMEGMGRPPEMEPGLDHGALIRYEMSAGDEVKGAGQSKT
ncbi:hypothetical protein DID88_003383 [Monilinia fructigena]|uniref:Uncharacterized protein n=1 Tax=Monilinia fructigena TaxID=38457 RepID=A0A395IUN1_9HELO|nr:hypothetical protein DID88_003383 [Monilinia fructigena]